MSSSGPPTPSRLSIPGANRSQDDDSRTVAAQMDRLNINPPQAGRHRSPSPMARVAGQAQAKSPTVSRPGTRNGVSAVNRSAQPESPRSNRSPLLGRRDSHGTMASPSLRRKSSSNFSVRSPSQSRAPPSPVLEQPPVTASSIACDHFKRELLQHDSYGPNSPDTVVILHDACYGHRFSRPKVAKGILSLIVERPERLQASTWGLSGAYVKLGERHAAGSHSIHPRREPDSQLPFRILKSTRSTPITSPVVANVHGAKWTQELKQMSEAAEARLQAGGKELIRPDTPNGNKNKPQLHEGDLYLCKDSLEAFQGAIGSVLDGVDIVFGATASGRDTTKAFVCVRPPGHHCSSDHPSGFCWLNNVHIGIEHAAQAHGLTHAAIIDFDLHHGDGSQSITWDRNAKAAKAPKNAPLAKKTAIGYYSIHDINSYPCEWGEADKVQSASLCIENAHSQSVWNVHLQPWKTEDEFWALYESRYLVLLDKARLFLCHHTQRIQSLTGAVRPKAAIFVSAGFDASEHEGEGMQRHKVNVPTSFYARFTADIVKLANETGTAVEGRVISVLEGGYSDRALMSGVMSHIVGLTQTRKSDSSPSLDAGWWNLSALLEMETMLRPSQPLPVQVKKRPNEQGNYASPTQSFTAKVIDPEKMLRSVSGNTRTIITSRPPTPPPPEVDWATAAHELGKLLIPTDRPVTSCKHEELNEPKIKKERHSSIGLPAVAPSTDRVTRGRRSKAADSAEVSAGPNVKRNPARRRTISDLPTPHEIDDHDYAISMVDSSTRPSTSAGSPVKDVFTAGEASSTASRHSSASRQSSPPPNHATLTQPKTRRTSGGGVGVVKRPGISRQPSQASIKEESSSLASVTSTSKPAVRRAATDSAAPSIEQLAARVKKITLHPPKVDVGGKAAGTQSTKPASKPVRKAPAPRASKSTSVGSRALELQQTLPGPHASAVGPGIDVKTDTFIPSAVDKPLLDFEQHDVTSTGADAAASLTKATQPLSDAQAQHPGGLRPVPDELSPALYGPSSRLPESSSPIDLSNYDPQFIPFQPPQPFEAARPVKPEQIVWTTPQTVAQGPPPPATPVRPQSQGVGTGKENLYIGNSVGPIPFSPQNKANP